MLRVQAVDVLEPPLDELEELPELEVLEPPELDELLELELLGELDELELEVEQLPKIGLQTLILTVSWTAALA